MTSWCLYYDIKKKLSNKRVMTTTIVKDKQTPTVDGPKGDIPINDL